MRGNCEAAAPAVEVVAAFDGATQEVRWLCGGDYRVGPGADASYPLADERLPARGWPLVHDAGDGYLLVFTRAMTGELREEGHAIPFDALIASGRARPVPELGEGAHACALDFGARFRVELGASVFDVSAGFPPQPLALAPSLDWIQLVLTGATSSLLTIALLLYLALPRPVDKLTLSREIVARAHYLLVPPPIPAPPPRVRKLRTTISVGHELRRAEARTHTHRARRVHAEPSPGSLLVERSGLAEDLFRDGFAPIRDQPVLGSAELAALDSLSSPRVPEFPSGGSLGLHGEGQGGGGRSFGTIGLAPLPQASRPGGAETLMPGRVRRTPQARLIFGPPTVVGALDRDVARRVVRRHQVEAQYCYEKVLLVEPLLEGALTVDVTVSPSGAVLVAGISDATITVPSLNDCLSDAFLRWTFPMSWPAPDRLSYARFPLTLKNPRN